MGDEVAAGQRAPAARAAAPAAALDLRGLKCPLPVLRTRRALMRLDPGATLEVRCTDPLATLDIPHLVRETGDALLGIERFEGETCFRIRKAPRASEDPSGGADVDLGR